MKSPTILTIAYVMTSLMFAGACGHPTAPSASPTPSSNTPPRPQSSPTPLIVASGTIWAHFADGVRPYANARFSGYVFEPQRGYTLGWMTTDARGGYEVSFPQDARVVLFAGSSAYQPCAVTLTGTGTISRDIRVVSDTQQLGARLPPELAAQEPTLSGVVYETTATGRQPLSGVVLELDAFGGMGIVSALTMTDDEGRYVFCGLADQQSTYLFALRPGYRSFERTVALNGQNVELDIEMRR